MNTDKYDSDDVVGYSLQIKILRIGFQTLERHWIGTEATCRRKAKLISNFHSIESIEPVTGKQWCRGYGDPRDKSKFS
jgi:hypothetical protein